MFLDHAATIGLLEERMDTNVLRDFPLPVKRALVNEVVSYFLDKPSSEKVLHSEDHVKWTFEIIGQSFSLPISDFDTIAKAIDIYWNWLQSSFTRPEPMRENFQFFMAEMFRHFSLLFADRQYANDEEERRHVELCTRVLQNIEYFARESSKMMSKKTFKVLLRVLLSSTDYIVRVSANARFANDLCPVLLRVLIDLWLRSGTKEPELWDQLSSLYANWGARLPPIEQWNATTMALSKRVARILYGPSEGTLTIKISSDVGSKISIDDDYCYFAWHRFLHIIGNPNLFTNDPEIYKTAMEGIATLVDYLMSVGLRKSKKTHVTPLPPSGNTLLDIFGEWLFEAAFQSRQDFEHGHAEAFGALCRIFSVQGGAEFHGSYLARFYRGLTSGLRADNGYVKCHILTNCDRLFATNLTGLSTVLPVFLQVIHEVLSSNQPPFAIPMAFAELRAACITILGSILCLPQLLDGLPCQSLAVEYVDTLNSQNNSIFRSLTQLRAMDSKDANDLRTFSEIKPYLVDMLLEALTTERDAQNLTMILWTLYVYIYADETTAGDTASRFVSQVHEWILGKSSIPVEVSLCAVSCLKGLAEIYQDMPEREGVVRHMLISLNSFLEANLAKYESVSHRLLAACLNCIQAWIIPAYDILSDNVIMEPLVANMVQAMSLQAASDDVSRVGRNNAKTAVKRVPSVMGTGRSMSTKRMTTVTMKEQGNVQVVHQAANELMGAIMNVCGYYPRPHGPDILSTPNNEDDVFNSVDDFAFRSNPEQYKATFIINNTTVLSVIERHHDFANSGYVTCLIRDVTGKYMWEFQEQHSPLNPREKREIDRETHPFAQQILLAEKEAEMKAAAEEAERQARAEKEAQDALMEKMRLEAEAEAAAEAAAIAKAEAEAEAAAAAQKAKEEAEAAAQKAKEEEEAAAQKAQAEAEARAKAWEAMTEEERMIAEAEAEAEEAVAAHKAKAEAEAAAAAEAEAAEELEVEADPQEDAVDDGEETNPESADANPDEEEENEDEEDEDEDAAGVGDEDGMSREDARAAKRAARKKDRAAKRAARKEAREQRGGEAPSKRDRASTKALLDEINVAAAEPASFMNNTLSESHLKGEMGMFHKGFVALIANHTVEQKRQETELPNPMNYVAPAHPPTRRYVAENQTKLEETRRFLNHLGVINTDARSKCTMLEQSSKLFRSIKLLDRLTERERRSVTVLLRKHEQRTMQALLANEGGDKRYTAFISSIGWPVKLSEHSGFMGQLDRTGSGEVAPYYADPESEVIWHVPTLMPSDGGDGSLEVKEKRLSADTVFVIWDENLRDLPLQLSATCLTYLIYIRPLPNSHYRIQIRFNGDAPPDTILPGPLRDEMIVSEPVLGKLVRQTAVNISRMLEDVDDEGGPQSHAYRPYPMRNEQLKLVASNEMEGLGMGNFYRQFFTPFEAPKENKKKRRGRRAKDGEEGPVVGGGKGAKKKGARKKKKGKKSKKGKETEEEEGKDEEEEGKEDKEVEEVEVVEVEG